jgi:hypothetical protein
VEGAANVPGLFQHLKRGPKAAARSIPAPEGGAKPHTRVLGRAKPQVLTRSPWRGAEPRSIQEDYQPLKYRLMAC